MDYSDLSFGLLIGLIGGGASGLLGVSSGGFLVPLIALSLGIDQHVAQGVSLVAQVPPTSLSGVVQYRRSGHAVPWRWVLLLSVGFVAGGIAGAWGADAIPDRVLRWMFVGYLLLLGTLAMLRSRGTNAASTSADGPADVPAVTLGAATLIGVGMVSGLSSGLLGIGGGLAITALLGAGLKLPQHQAQALALAVTTLPLTLPAAWVYAEKSRGLPWWLVAGIILGLWGGTWMGSRLAILIAEPTLRRFMVVAIFAMAAVMAWHTYAS
jgi:uncharacterized membrane protein YfcA